MEDVAVSSGSRLEKCGVEGLHNSLLYRVCRLRVLRFSRTAMTGSRLKPTMRSAVSTPTAPNPVVTRVLRSTREGGNYPRV